MSTAAALAQFVTCVVVHVADGDTLTVRCSADGVSQSHVVRLAKVDAPEKGQAFGAVSRRHLVAVCLRQPASVTPLSTDRYGRTVAKVSCAGADAGGTQVAAGLAWVFDRHASGRELYRLQEQARSSRAGLWVEAAPVAPWEWRAARRQADNRRRW